MGDMAYNIQETFTCTLTASSHVAHLTALDTCLGNGITSKTSIHCTKSLNLQGKIWLPEHGHEVSALLGTVLPDLWVALPRLGVSDGSSVTSASPMQLFWMPESISRGLRASVWAGGLSPSFGSSLLGFSYL